MEHNDQDGTVMASLKEIVHYNMFLTEAIFELLAECGLLTGEEILERVKKLKSETHLVFRWLQ